MVGRGLLLVISLLLGLVSGCTSDPHQGFLGYWSSVSPKHLFRIYRDGDAILIENLMPGLSDMMSGPQSIALSVEGKGLRLNGPIGGTTLALGENGDRLYLFNMSLSRTSDQAAQQMLAEIQLEREQWQHAAKACQALGEEYRSANSELTQRQSEGALSAEQYLKEVATLARTFRSRADSLSPKCYLPYAGR